MRVTYNLQILLGAVTGVLTGWFIGHGGCPPALGIPLLTILDLCGQVFINLLKMILVPLLFSSIIVGVANLKTATYAKKIWKPLAAYFVCTPILAAVTGLIAANIFKPGVGLSTDLFNAPQAIPAQTLTAGGFISNFTTSLFANPIAAMAQNNIL